jgi:hypothetical protein
MLADKVRGATAGEKLFVDDVFSTWLYTGNGSTQTITNGIDLAGKGGLVWIKARSATTNNFLFDTNRGVLNEINSNTIEAQANLSSSLTAFNSDGFSIGSASGINVNAVLYASWTFRKSPKFFDVVTYTGDGVGGRTISHSIGQVPGMIIVKNTTIGTLNGYNTDWQVYHRNLEAGKMLKLNQTGAVYNNSSFGAVSESSFGVENIANDQGAHLNVSGQSYVAYIFAHDTASDGMIQCGSFTTDGSGNATVNLGWEPQFLMFKRTDATSDWWAVDVMRGFPVTGTFQYLRPNLANGETTENSGGGFYPTAQGFQAKLNASSTWVYLAIRRPNKPPTSGTQVFNTIARTGTGAATTVSAGFPVDLAIIKHRTNARGFATVDRLRGNRYIYLGILNGTGSSVVETLSTSVFPSDTFAVQDGVKIGTDLNVNGSGAGYGNWFFKRAPGFMDVVCYTGTGVARTISHNLGVKPELILVKRRASNASSDWPTYFGDALAVIWANIQNAQNTTTDPWNETEPTSSVFSLDSSTLVNAVGSGADDYVAYLFASLPGISKVGSYTGNGGTVNTDGTSQTINCGFATGSRFVLIKRTDLAGNWFVFDTARGIVAGNDPYLLLNSAADEVTTVDAVDTDTSGFVVNQTSGTNLNVTSATYIYLAIA